MTLDLCFRSDGFGVIDTYLITFIQNPEDINLKRIHKKESYAYVSASGFVLSTFMNSTNFKNNCETANPPPSPPHFQMRKQDRER